MLRRRRNFILGPYAHILVIVIWAMAAPRRAESHISHDSSIASRAGHATVPSRWVGVLAQAPEGPDSGASKGADESPVRQQARRDAQRLRQALALLIILILIFTIATLVIVRFSKRYRAYLMDRKAPPTPSDDVWAMHRLPDEAPPADPKDFGKEE